MDFSKFLKDNNLKGCQIAEFLGVSGAYVSQVCSGVSKLSSDKLNLILNNKEWDTSALSEKSVVAIAIDHSTANAESPSVSPDASERAVLIKEIEMLRQIIKDKDETIALLTSLLKK